MKSFWEAIIYLALMSGFCVVPPFFEVSYEDYCSCPFSWLSAFATTDSTIPYLVSVASLGNDLAEFVRHLTKHLTSLILYLTEFFLKQHNCVYVLFWVYNQTSSPSERDSGLFLPACVPRAKEVLFGRYYYDWFKGGFKWLLHSSFKYYACLLYYLLHFVLKPEF